MSCSTPRRPPPPPPPPPTPVTSGTITITPNVAAVAPGQNFQFSASNSNGGTIQWSVSGGGSIDQTGKYTAPPSVSQSENVTVTAALAANTQIYATAVVSVIQPGQIACPLATGNPQVAQYTVYLPAPGGASVEFGTTTSYGLNTWQVPAPTSTRRPAPALGGRNAGQHHLPHARPRSASGWRRVQRCRPDLHDGHAARDSGHQDRHQWHAAAGHRDVEHRQPAHRHPGLRHRSPGQRDLDLQLSAQQCRHRAGRAVDAQRRPDHDHLVPVVADFPAAAVEPDQRDSRDRPGRQHGALPDHGRSSTRSFWPTPACTMPRAILTSSRAFTTMCWCCPTVTGWC